MALITPAARRSFDHLFCTAVRANIGVQASDEVTVHPADAPGGKGEHKRTLVLLTCASLRFKLVAVFQVVDEPLAKAYFASVGGSADPLERLSEQGNLCCGALNRSLLPYMPHVGLSTPSILVGVASKLLAALQAEHVSHFAVHINHDHVLDVALCMRGRATVDFVVDTDEVTAETSELELL
jgi:hypothetical protein